MKVQPIERGRINSGECEGFGYETICFKEEGFIIKQIVDADEKRKAYRLRHEIFCGELNWVLQSMNGLEIDEYDENAVFFGVFDANQNLVSFVRLILSDRQFMMEKEFRSLVSPSHHIRKEPDTVEMSRLCVAPQVRNGQSGGNFGVHKISMLLFKAVYQWCKLNHIRYIYAVTEVKVYRLYCLKGFPYRPVGEHVKMPDGVVVAAVLMDWEEFEFLSITKKPELIDWFRRRQVFSLPEQLQQHDFCLTR